MPTFSQVLTPTSICFLLHTFVLTYNIVSPQNLNRPFFSPKKVLTCFQFDCVGIKAFQANISFFFIDGFLQLLRSNCSRHDEIHIGMTVSEETDSRNSALWRWATVSQQSLEPRLRANQHI